MRKVILTLAAVCWLCRSSSAQVISVEGGVDAFRQNLYSGPTSAARVEDPLPAASAGLAAYLQVSDLRSYYGAYLTAHRGATRLVNPAFDLGRAPDVENGRQSLYAAMFGWRAFILDLEGDCDCPTWGEENWLQRALFVEVAIGPGLQRWEALGSKRFEVDRWGGAYLARLGLSHRLAKSLDVYAALGAFGLIGPAEEFGSNNSLALRASGGFAIRL